MKIFTLRARTLLPLAAVGGALLLGLAAVFLVPPVQSAFSSTSGRQLPIYSVQTDEKKAALGINCAWDDADILPMISTLQEYDVKATFFLLGEWAAKYPAAARTIALAGQEIGSHANTHRDLDTLSEEEILQEIASSCQNIEAACGVRPVLLRPPSGSYNDAVIQCIHRAGCIPIQWNLDTLDWQGLSAEEIAARVSRQLQPGSILLLHAGAEYSAEALPLILQTARQIGYQLVPVGELIDPDSETVDHTGMQLAAPAS